MIKIDKVYHAIAGFFIGAVAYVVSLDYGASVILAVLIAMISALAIGMFKEFRDKYRNDGQFDWWDVLATVAGSPIGVLLGVLIVKILG